MSKLKTIRTNAHLSQKQLSIKTKISVSTIQAYEQRVRDINKAGYQTLVLLANALNCNVSDLIETDNVFSNNV